MDAAQAAQQVAHASLAQCLALVEALAERVSRLEGIACGLDDAAAELRRALAHAPCSCGRCEACLAAQRDERHHRRADARLLREAA